MSGEYAKKLELLRALMTQEGVDAYIVPRGDEYLGEFVAPYAERLTFLTGFTGSAGFAAVTQDHAVVMSDGRYTIQLAQQVDQDCFEIGDSTKYPLKQWLCDHLPEEAKVGFDPLLHSFKQVEAWDQTLAIKDIELCPIEANLIDPIWVDQPQPPVGQVCSFPEALAGQSTKEKLHLICEELAEQGVDYYLITQPDSIAWLLNVRGSDLDFLPVVLSRVLVDVQQKTVRWFVDPAKLDDAMPDFVSVQSLIEVEDALLSLSDKLVAMDSAHSSYWFYLCLEEAGARCVDVKDPCIAPKAAKTQAEQATIRSVHVLDGVALVKLLAWLGGNAIGADELSVEAKLEAFRAEHPAYRGPSFSTIAGFGPNGAIVHYRANAKTALSLQKGNLLLLDSGGQYFEPESGLAGTTDITRTIAIGEVGEETKRHFTRVLQGHIAVARAQFPMHTNGAQIDALARQPLWQDGLDYAHGTGHGVGCYLHVHEEAASISPRGQDVFTPGMLLSNEPGYYEEGSHGIRCENLVFVQSAVQAGMLCFETVSLVPFDRNLILVELLSADEKVWIDSYHGRVLEALVDKGLSHSNISWLRQACAPL